MKLSRSSWLAPLLVSAVLVACGGGNTNPESSFDDSSSNGANEVPSQPLPLTTGRMSTVCGADAGACSADSQCPAHVPCGCTVGYCLPQSKCTTNADCISGRSCMLSVPFIFREPDGGEVDYAPHGPDDVGGFSHDEPYGYFCTTDGDGCVPTPDQQPTWACVFNGTTWQPGESI